MYNSFHSGSNSSAGWYLSFWRRQAAISAETAITHSDDRTRDGRITIRTLRQRCASSLKRKAINSNSTNTICGCLLRAQRVTQTERSQTRPAETFRAPLRQKAGLSCGSSPWRQPSDPIGAELSLLEAGRRDCPQTAARPACDRSRLQGWQRLRRRQARLSKV